LGQWGTPFTIDVKKNGNVGINTVDPQATFHFVGSNDNAPLTNGVYINGNVGIGTINPGDSDVHVFGNLYTQNGLGLNTASPTGSNVPLYCTLTYDEPGQPKVGFLSYGSGSSRKYKEDIRPLVVNKERLLSLQPVSFRWKNSNIRSTGLIAEDVAQKFPELVYINTTAGIYNVHYDRINVYLIPVIKEHEEEINEIEKEINELDNLIKE
jgi:hypothetical protein